MSAFPGDLATPTFAKVLTTNATDASFPSKIPTTTAPTTATAGVLNTTLSGTAPKRMMFVFYAIGADNVTFKARVIGWKYVSTLYVPVVLAEVTCTASAVVGIAAAAVLNTERFADTIALASGYPADSSRVYSPTGDVVGHLIVDLEGCNLIEVTFNMNGSATSANALYAAL